MMVCPRRATNSGLLVVAWLLFVALAIEPTGLLAVDLRSPSAGTFSPDGKTLFIANRATATVSAFDLRAAELSEIDGRKPSWEYPVGTEPVDIVAFDDQLLVLDAEQAQLIVLSAGSQYQKQQTISLPDRPVRIVVNPSKRKAFVTCLWSKQLVRLDQGNDGKWKQSAQISLPFCPREMLLLPNKQLLVAGAFAAKLACLDLDAFKLLGEHSLQGHGIGSMVATEEAVFLTMQRIDPAAHSSRNDIHWGSLISNQMVKIPLSSLADKKLSPVETELGQPGAGAADPSAILHLGQKRFLMTLSGSAELAIVEPNLGIVERLQAGVGPSRIASSDRYVAVLDRFSNSVLVIDREALLNDGVLSSDNWGESSATLRLSAETELTTVQRGEQLFRSGTLSHDSWMSCHSCHTDGHSSGQQNDNQSDGGFGAPKRIPSLLGVAETAPWAWTGKVASLEEQIENSIASTMHGKPLEKEQIADLVAYLNSLKPTKYATVNSSEERAGGKIFERENCGKCHSNGIFTSAQTYDVGFSDSQGNTRFNPPSLRGLRLRSSYLHDGRFQDLRDVFLKAQHQLSAELTERELDQLLQYLNSL
ncbi:MAG: cytochrome c peroxidase [Planctomycetota bacterium]